VAQAGTVATEELPELQAAPLGRTVQMECGGGTAEGEKSGKPVTNAEWKELLPEAAAERSEPFQPLERDKDYWKFRPDAPDEMWFNNLYSVTVRRHSTDPVFKSSGGMIQLGINAIDHTARHDWREFQAIKNQLAGPECEAFELYPAESRLIDPSNYYALWCFPGIKRLKIGQEARRVINQDVADSPQRALPK
jgi:hypothetical protein